MTIGATKMKLEITITKWICSLFLLTSTAQTHAYTPPPVGAQFFTTTGNGDFIHEVISNRDDRFTVRSLKVGESKHSETVRFLGLITFSKQLNEDIFAGDREKALALFPMKVGNKVTFSHYGGSGNRWYRNHIIEVVSEQTAQIGPEKSTVFSLKINSESPGFMKLDGVCEFAPQLGVCIRFVGDLFVRDNSALTGQTSVVMKKVVLNGIELKIEP
jgi:hypothetical protein